MIETETKIKVLIKLYELENKGKMFSIQELTDLTKINFNYEPLKNWLLKEKIMEQDGFVKIIKDVKGGNREFYVKVYKINYDLIDTILCAELPTKIIYQRLLDGKIPVFPPLKPRKNEKHENTLP